MIQLVELCRKHKIKLRLIVYPWQNNIGDKKHQHSGRFKPFSRGKTDTTDSIFVPLESFY